MLDIQWYPGHMAKTKRLLCAQLSKVDLVIELCDARIPQSSRNPDLGKLIAHKRRVLLLCKADLADPISTKEWLSHFYSLGIDAMDYDACSQKTKKAKMLIEKAAARVLERAKQRGLVKTIRAMVVGVPNVGKSTFINRLYGGSVTRVADRPGVTRANQWVKISPCLELLDTPGMLWPKQDDALAASRLAYIGAIRDAVYDQEALCVQLLRDLLRATPNAAMERFKLNNKCAEDYELLEGVCKGRGFLRKGAICDLDRACAVILDEFREGRVGRITLEMPPKASETTLFPEGHKEYMS